MKKFEITDIDTWGEASKVKEFVWKDTTFFNDETNENLTEEEFSKFMGQIIDALRQIISDEKIFSKNITYFISLINDFFVAGINANSALSLINIGIQNNVDFSWSFFNNNNTVKFEIYDLDTWKFATENILIWENKIFQIAPDKKFSEILFVKIMMLFLNRSFNTLKARHDLMKISISLILVGLRDGEDIPTILRVLLSNIEENNSVIKSSSSNLSVANSSSGVNNNFNTQVNNLNNLDLTPPSKISLILGFVLLVGGFIYMLNDILSGSWFDNPSKLIISTVIMFCSIPFFVKYSSERSKYFYKVVCADMAQWVGHSSNDLIMKWGAPTKTYKFPTDKTMTVLEYKDSIRNYVGVRSKGMYAGQSKTTKYIKSFFVKESVVINYKYDIT